MLAERIARAFHESYERLAPEFGYKTRERSAVAWEDVPEDNKGLMTATVQSLIDQEMIGPGTHTIGEPQAMPPLTRKQVKEYNKLSDEDKLKYLRTRLYAEAEIWADYMLRSNDTYYLTSTFMTRPPQH